MRLEGALILVSQAVSAGLMPVAFPLAQFASFARSFGALSGPYPTGIIGIQRHYTALQGFSGARRAIAVDGGLSVGGWESENERAKVRGIGRSEGIIANSEERLQLCNHLITLIRDPVIPRRLVSPGMCILKR